MLLRLLTSCVWSTTCQVSIHNHALTNGLGKTRAASVVMFFCDEYVRKLQEYVGNEGALTFEVTPTVASGALKPKPHAR